MSDQQDSDGVRIALSSPQLAAILARQSISQSEMSFNRIWGGLQIVGGVLEMVGAGTLCVLPEPTMASKAGCIAFGVHGSDTAAAGLRQVWTGQDTATLTSRGTAKLAEAVKVSPDMANNIGLSIDIAVSAGVAGSIKAVRASEITMGRIRLMKHEAKPGSRIGGHTFEKHVGRTEAQLRERLVREPRRQVVSPFTDLQTAEWAISRIMQANAARITTWARTHTGSVRLELTGDAGKKVGYGVIRRTGEMVSLSKVQMFLIRKEYNGMPYYILTAYLTP
ncbi:RNase A-like domain-containing protein [Burkholderia sp. Ax-1724]|uniref:RNase A-like domain-containing protein n=1 Tax=Burkholderia sp. Ax-1724 TaxID=2608336 RepID=UPI0014233469|nr:RNase A-like domain-containing protein [Burkholderia sp. Ax-1724]NIF54411.1 hypothetical protein [Burkholderia sp. Ax-1724]